jgi:hypothetical protein
MFAQRHNATRTRSSSWWPWEEGGGTKSSHPPTAVAIRPATTAAASDADRRPTLTLVSSPQRKPFISLPSEKRYGMVYFGLLGHTVTSGTGHERSRGCLKGSIPMHRFYLAPILLSVPASTGALAHSGTDQEEKACKPDVQRFCRQLMDQGDFTILACLKENRAKLSHACLDVAIANSRQKKIRQALIQNQKSLALADFHYQYAPITPRAA